MAKKTTSNGQKKVNKPSLDTVQQTHAALPPSPQVNMMHLFGIDDGYLDVKTEEQYAQKLEKMTITDLQTHSHIVGVVPLEPREKLTAFLLKKYRETKARQLPPRVIQTPINPQFADFHKNFCAESLK